MDLEAQVGQKLTVTEAALQFSISSVFMILINKYVATVFPYLSLVILIQNIITLIFLKLWKPTLKIDHNVAFRWIPCVFLFCINIYSSLLALSNVSVPTFTVFRNLQPIISTLLDVIIRNESTSVNNVICLGVIFLGAYVYAYGQINFDTRGYTWVMIHVLSMSLYSIAVKYSINSYNLHAYEMSFYNNFMSLFFLLLIVSFESPMEHTLYNCVEYMPCWTSIMMSGYGAFCISVTGFQAQEHLSPTSYLTCNNLSKIPAIILSYIIWQRQTSVYEVIGIIISLTGGFLYSLSTRELLHTLFFWPRHSNEAVEESR